MSTASSYAPSGALGKIVIGFLVFNALLELTSAVFVSGFSGKDAWPLSFVSGVYVLLSVIMVPTMLMTCFVFCLWWHRVVKNLSALGAHDLEFTPRSAVWSFFIPFVNLFRPPEAGQEIWKASDPALVDNTPVSRNNVAHLPLIGVWWTLFVFGNVFGTAGARFDDGLAGMVLVLVSHLLSTAAAICGLVMVQRIAERQDARFRVLRGGAAAAVATVPTLPQMETAG